VLQLDDFTPSQLGEIRPLLWRRVPSREWVKKRLPTYSPIAWAFALRISCKAMTDLKAKHRRWAREEALRSVGPRLWRYLSARAQPYELPGVIEGLWRLPVGEMRCGIGSCGVPRPSMADYVRGPEATREVTAASAC
jgi:hypothetical protein